MATAVASDAAGNPILLKTSRSDAGRERLRHEANLLRRCVHPNVVELVDLREGTGDTTLVQRWAGSRTVACLGSIDTAEAAGIIAALAGTVADLHEAGVCHRRIDESHVVIAPDGRPILCGFAEATEGSEAQPDDVAAVGRILAGLAGRDVDVEPIPDRARLPFRRQRWSGYYRRALLNLADLATANEAQQRPTARRLAAMITAAVPRATLAPAASRGPQASLGGSWATRTDRPAAPASAQPATLGRSGAITAAAPARSSQRPPAEPRPADHDEWEEFWAAPAPGSNATETSHGEHVPCSGRTSEDGDPVPPPDWPDAPAPQTEIRASRSRSWPVARVVAAVAGIALLMAGALDLHQRSSGDRGITQISPRDLDSGAGSTARGRARCQLARPPKADVDGDGCQEAVTLDGRLATAGGTQFEIGRPGDKVVLGDWRCDGTVTPAVLRPSTGEVFVFRSWTVDNGEITVPATSVVAGADGLRATPRGRCEVLVVTRPGDQPVDIPSDRS